MAIPNPAKKRRRFELNIVGRSARAAAFSAMRAGADVSAADAFGDEDLKAWVRFMGPVRRFPSGLKGALAGMEGAPFLYTGGLDDSPRIIDALARLRPLWGNPGPVIRRARDPIRLARVLGDAGLPPPETRRADDPPPSARGWLRKPMGARRTSRILRAGGKGSAAQGRGSWYWQREARGPSGSALFVASAAGCAYLGATRQLVGEPWLHAAPFSWCGNVGPLDPGRSAERLLRDAGEAAARAFGLRGLFGIDFVLEDGIPRPVELNPRYPASVEVLEHALGFSAITLHRLAFLEPGKAPREPRARSRETLGKAVVFAPADVVLGSDLLGIHPPDPHAFPEAADLPPRGSRIRKGLPLVSVFARARGEGPCVDALRGAASRILRHFHAAPDAGY